MFYMFDEKFRAVLDTSNAFIKKARELYPGEIALSGSEILNIMEQGFRIKLDIVSTSFEENDINNTYGAMLGVELNEDDSIKSATIILNNECPTEFQRFSLMHEIGHILMHAWRNEDKYKDSYVVCTHINYKLQDIKKEVYEKDEYLRNEQIANIFALRTLMPFDIIIEKFSDGYSIDKLAKDFVINKEAVISRLALGY